MNRTAARTSRRYDVTASQALHYALLVALGLLVVFAFGVAAGTGVLGAAGLHFGGLVTAAVVVAPIVKRAGRAFGRTFARAVA